MLISTTKKHKQQITKIVIVEKWHKDIITGSSFVVKKIAMPHRVIIMSIKKMAPARNANSMRLSQHLASLSGLRLLAQNSYKHNINVVLFSWSVSTWEATSSKYGDKRRLVLLSLSYTNTIIYSLTVSPDCQIVKLYADHKFYSSSCWRQKGTQKQLDLTLKSLYMFFFLISAVSTESTM